jgi:hypothetical protein
MALFDNKISKYILAVSLILVASIIGKKFKGYIDNGNPSNDYELIKNYLLNDDKTVFRSNRPNLWIHSKYEINARKWKSFGSRNTYDLNQPYLHITIKSIIHECGRDFNICLIDDETFAKLIPHWTIQMDGFAEPKRSQIRELGMLKLLHEYGGVVVPNSFLCFKNLSVIYNNTMETPFVCENINRTCGGASNDFVPDIQFMGAKKKCPVIADFITYVEDQCRRPHYTTEYEFVGTLSQWCVRAVQARKMRLLSGQNIGVMDANKKQILVDHLMEEEYLELSSSALGVYIPSDEFLRRPAFQWFSVLSLEEIIQGNYILAKYIIRVIDRINNSIETTGGGGVGVRGGGAALSI